MTHEITSAAEIGALIRRRRKSLRMTQPDLALVANVGIRFIVDAENGKETCQVGLLLRLMAALEIKMTMSSPTVSDDHDSEEHRKMRGLDL